MIVKNSQLHQLPDTQWPVELTPQQREQLLQEKLARVAVLHRNMKKHDLIRPDAVRS